MLNNYQWLVGTVTLKIFCLRLAVRYCAYMRTLRFKIQPTVKLFAAINHCGTFGSAGSKGVVRRYYWWIFIHFVGFCIFCGQLVVGVIVIGGSKTCNSLIGVELRSPYVIERRSNELEK